MNTQTLVTAKDLAAEYDEDDDEDSEADGRTDNNDDIMDVDNSGQWYDTRLVKGRGVVVLLDCVAFLITY